MSWYWWVIIYFVIALITCYVFSASYKNHDKEYTMASIITMGILFPITWIAYLFVTAVLLGKKKAEDK